MSLRKDQDDHDADCSILNETPLEDLNDTSVVIVDTPPPPAPSKEDDSHFDHGYAWVIACLAFIVTAVVAINIVSFGVLLTEFADHFNLPYARLSLLAACRMGFTYISGMCSGTWVHKYGCRRVGILGSIAAASGCIGGSFVNDFSALIALFGFVAGFGAGLSYVVPLVIITKYFKKKRVLATGASSAGFSFGSVLTGLTGGYIINLVGWRYTLAIMAMINIQCVVAIALMFNSEEKGKSEEEEAGSQGCCRKTCIKIVSSLNIMNFSVLKNRNFMIFAIATLPAMSGTYGFYALGPNRAYVQGIERVQSSFVSAAVGSCSFCGRIISGIVGNMHCMSSVVQYGSTVLIAGCLLMLSVNAGPWLSLHLVFGAIFGLFFGTYEGIAPSVVMDFLGAKQLSKGLGWVQAARGLCAFITLPLCGWLYDISGGYLVPFLVLGAFQVSGGLLVLGSYCLSQPRCKETSESSIK